MRNLCTTREPPSSRRQEDTGARANGAQKVRHDREHASVPWDPHAMLTGLYQHLQFGVTWLEAPTLPRDLQTGRPFAGPGRPLMIFQPAWPEEVLEWGFIM